MIHQSRGRQRIADFIKLYKYLLGIRRTSLEISCDKIHFTCILKYI